MTVELTRATRDHVERLADRLRDGDRHELTCLGLDPLSVLRISFLNSRYAATALVDGEVAACWGVGGTLLAQKGVPWLLTSPVCDKISPIFFARVYAFEVEKMLSIYPLLENFVLDGYDAAIRLLRLTGFTLDAPFPLAPGKPPFRRFWKEE